MADEKQEENNEEEQDDEFMSMSQVMGELNMDRDDLQDMVSQGEIRAYSSGEEMKFHEEEVSSLKGEDQDDGEQDGDGGEGQPDQSDQGDDEFMSMSQVMGELGVEKDDLEQMVSQGKIRAYRSDNEMKFREEDINELEESGRHEAIMDSDSHESVGDMTDIGDTVDEDLESAEEEELDLEDIEVEDEEIDELAEDLMLEEEEVEEEPSEEESSKGGTEEMIFEDEDMSEPDEAGEEEIDLDSEPLLDAEEEGGGTSGLSIDEEVEEEEVDSGKTMQMDSDIGGKTLQADEVDTGQEADTQRRRTTRRRTTQTAQRTRSAVGTQTAVGKIWMAVLIIGVIIGLESMLIGVDMARISTMSDQQEDVQPWSTSAPAELMLNLTSDRSLNPGKTQDNTSSSSQMN